MTKISWISVLKETIKFFVFVVIGSLLYRFSGDIAYHLDLGCSVTQTSVGADVKCGRTVATIYNGKNGKDGKDGRDGKNGQTAMCSMDNLNRWRLANQGLVGLLSSKYEKEMAELQRTTERDIKWKIRR